MDKIKKPKKVKTEYKQEVLNHGNVTFVKIMHEPLTRALFKNLTSQQVNKIVKNNIINCDDIYAMFEKNGQWCDDEVFDCACGRKLCNKWNQIINVEDENIILAVGSSCIKRFDWGESYLKLINDIRKKEKKELKQICIQEEKAKKELLRKAILYKQEMEELHTILVPFGKHEGEKLADLFDEDHQYLKWLNTITTTPKIKYYIEKLLSEELSPDMV